jgi:hypothetical protein
MELRDARMPEAFRSGAPSIADDLVFPWREEQPDRYALSARTISYPRSSVRTFDASASMTCGALSGLLIEAAAPLP